jgi:hypothetical protein
MRCQFFQQKGQKVAISPVASFKYVVTPSVLPDISNSDRIETAI